MRGSNALEEWRKDNLNRRPDVNQPQAPPEHLLDVKAVALMTGMSVHVVRRAIRASHLEAHRTKPLSGHYRIHPAHAKAWLDSLRVTPCTVDTPAA
ncbi:hypothetical protein GCM10012275_53250 [Longimycelium tulufanense]|uniref:Helix-turn-helix domain-containing protein n=1 Tax=Longimycelium tulufanense TaxID=907463 RepID=A0A8J3CGY2_9PSEU|nr:helix-turn-helix domain-containing protein [Longimycelium tulufanense]GGM75846.1 hypothetical protein GCM10012275_53250 [Longimycelium tulufanense]